MSDLELLGIVAAALGGGVVGASMSVILLSFRQPERFGPAPGSYRTDRLDPRLADRVRHLSDEWAAQHGHPEASGLAAGYLRDAAEDLQRRWMESR